MWKISIFIFADADESVAQNVEHNIMRHEGVCILQENERERNINIF